MKKPKPPFCMHCERRFGERSQADCHFHCHETESGKHEPSFSKTAIAEDAITNEGFLIIDVPCKHCGVTGSSKVDIREVFWE